MLISRATGGLGNSEMYTSVREELVANQRLKSKLPIFLEVCDNIQQFWKFIQAKFPSYQERRNFINTELKPIIEMFEKESIAPSDTIISAELERFDLEHVHGAWRKALSRVSTDPDGAVTAARTLLEEVCKHILDEEKVKYDAACDLPKLYRLVSERVGLAPSQYVDRLIKKVLGGCQVIVVGVGELRNKFGDAHGKGKAGLKPDFLHARLAVNLAGTMATFLLESWEKEKR
jgi:uncharacterized protein YfkK (UPF0435 family)